MLARISWQSLQQPPPLPCMPFLSSCLCSWHPGPMYGSSKQRLKFALRNITDSTTKYFYLLTSLDPVVAERMAGDVAAVPTEGKYEYLKSKLMEVYGLTDDQKADRLLDLSGPSQVCAHIQSLTVSQDFLMRQIFLRQLPEDVRVQVTALDADTLPALARKADIIYGRKAGTAIDLCVLPTHGEEIAATPP